MKQSEADWSQAQLLHGTISKPHDAGTPLQLAWYQPPQRVPSSQHESHFGTLTWPKTGSANAKKTCLQHLATAHFRNLEDK